MRLKHHRTLDAAAWAKHSKTRQILMIANELNRAGNWLIKNDLTEVKDCYERALELIYLTAGDLRRPEKTRELMRLKEILAGHYAHKTFNPKQNAALIKALLLLDPLAWTQLQKKD